MKRFKQNRRQASKEFRRTAQKTKAINVTPSIARGGVRL